MWVLCAHLIELLFVYLLDFFESDKIQIDIRKLNYLARLVYIAENRNTTDVSCFKKRDIYLPIMLIPAKHVMGLVRCSDININYFFLKMLLVM
jgi:hypothetical protein